MGLYIANMVACVVIFVWCTWCVMCKRVHDGIIGKIIFSAGSLAALGVIIGPQTGYEPPNRVAEVALNVVMAAIGLRHMTIRYIWPRVVRVFRSNQAKRTKK